ncbi:MAG: DUF1700 domain-containing protein [Lachnospiraceae bacterium]|nr:DUF1700 domain-containing protein [Lachnospiraceae bacterium]
MKKQEFIDEIRMRMEGLPEEEVTKSIDYYSEMIDDRIEDGMAEEEAVDAVGTVDDAVKGILDNIPLTKVIKAKTKPSRKLKVWEIVLLAVGSPIWFPLLVCWILLIVLFYCVIWIIVIAFFAVDFALMVSGLASFIVGIMALFHAGPTYPLLAIGAGLFLLGGGLMLLIPLIKLAKVTGKLAKVIVLWIKSWFVPKKKAVNEEQEG